MAAPFKVILRKNRPTLRRNLLRQTMELTECIEIHVSSESSQKFEFIWKLTRLQTEKFQQKIKIFSFFFLHIPWGGFPLFVVRPLKTLSFESSELKSSMSFIHPPESQGFLRMLREYTKLYRQKFIVFGFWFLWFVAKKLFLNSRFSLEKGINWVVFVAQVLH